MQSTDTLNDTTPPGCPAGRGWSRNIFRWAVPALLAVVVGWVALGPGASFAWDAMRANLDGWQAWTGRHLVPALLVFFCAYAVATALPLPVLTSMSLLAGALFGRPLGAAVASLAYAAGVTVAFLAARHLLRNRVRSRAGPWLRRVEHGVRRDGGYYLLTLRLMPSIPFFLINFLMALTPIRTRTYTLVSWAAVLPLTFVCAGVGTRLAALRSPADAVSLPMLGTLAALAVVPLAARKVLTLVRPPRYTPSSV